MNRSATLAFLLLATLPGLTQSLTGVVQDASGQPAPFAALKLLRATDTTFVQGTVADSAGRYVFRNVATGTYRVQASQVGAGTVFSPIITLLDGQITDVAPLVLRSESRALATVTVRAKKPYVEQQADKTVLNVANDATAQSKTAYELLQQAPGVVIDPNDNIRMAGKQGATVFIDGKPTNLSNADLANLLRATPAANLDKVELITNPSARFDAQGGAGIINLRFRRDRSLGLNGSASGGYGQSDNYRANLAGDLNYRAKRLNAFGNVALSDNFQRTNVAIDRVAVGSQFQQRGVDKDGTRAIVYKTGLDVFLDARQTLGVIVAGNAADNLFGTYTTTQIIRAGRVDSTLLNRVDNPSQNQRRNVALNYRYADTTGMEVNLDADWTRFNNVAPNTLTSQPLRPGGELGTPFRQRQDGQTDITILTLKADVVKAWKASTGAMLKLEAGAKHTDVDTDNRLSAFSGLTDVVDVARTNRFTYRERVSALYASLNRAKGKWNAQAGLRAEYANVQGRSVDLLERSISKPDTTYLSLFPTAFVQYQATENGQVSLNYGRRIGRPNYQSLNPFTLPIDPFTSERGNPFLRPSFTHNVELSYTYKWATTLKLSYSRTDDFATEIIQQQGVIAFATVANVGRAEGMNVSLSTPYQFTKWWSSYVYAGATWNRFVGQFSPTEPFSQRAFAFDGYMQHSFTLAKAWSAQVSGFWSAPTVQTVYRIGGLGALNLSVQKKAFSERATFTLAVDDVLNTMRWRQSADFGTDPATRQQFQINRKWESRRVSLRFAYRFGSDQIKAARDRSTAPDAGRIKEKGNF